MNLQASFTLQGHNPDVLTCIANLSNDEVFTPPEFANQMLDTLERAWAESNHGASIWADQTVTFLDPFTKSGVFLREITRRLTDGLETQIPDLEERVDHILTKQVFGIGITQLTSLLARRSVYCSKDATGEHSIAKSFDRDWGNIWFERTEHTWAGRKRVRRVNPLTGDEELVEEFGTGRCRFCGASEGEYARDEFLETHAYAFIHTDDIKARVNELFGAEMQFDVIIGNPPYQLDDGGHGTSAAPVYHSFVEQAKALEPRMLTMVIPARWFTGGKGLDSFRHQMLADDRMRSLDIFEDSRDCFPGVDVAGGITYFLWHRDAPGLCEVTNHAKGVMGATVARRLLEPGAKVFIRSNEALEILRAVFAAEGARDFALPEIRRLSGSISARKPFGLSSNFRGLPEKLASDDVMIYQNGGTAWVSREKVAAGKALIDRWKVLISYTSSEHAGQSDSKGMRRVLARVEVMAPGTVGTESYLVGGSFDNEESAMNLVRYLRTRFVRFLVSPLVTTQHVTRGSFEFVPMQDFSRPWTDEELYEKYKLTPNQVAHIESQIKPMGLDDV